VRIGNTLSWPDVPVTVPVTAPATAPGSPVRACSAEDQVMMQRAVVLAAFVVAAMVTVAARQAPDGAPRMPLAEFKRAFDAGAVVVLDVRDASSYAAAHIPGAILVPLDALAKKAPELKALRKPIVAYCA
jgi:hypothetical protein